MQSSYLTPEIQELVFRINAKKEAYNKAMRDDREFEYVRELYKEWKALEKKYRQSVSNIYAAYPPRS